MRCPHAKRSLKLIFLKDGSAVCPSCYTGPSDRNVRTGKKIWAGSEVYTPSQIEQKNHDWFERTAARAAENRKRNDARVRPSLRDKGVL